MPRTKIDDTVILSLGSRRAQLTAEIKAIESADLPAKRGELADIETKLKEIDPTILSLEEEAAEAAAEVAKAAAAQKKARDDEDAAAARDGYEIRRDEETKEDERK